MTMIQKGTEKNGMKKEREKTLKKKAVAFFLARVCVVLARETVDGGGRTSVFGALLGRRRGIEERTSAPSFSGQKKRENLKKILEP